MLETKLKEKDVVLPFGSANKQERAPGYASVFPFCGVASLGAGAGEVGGKDEAVNLVEGERGVRNNFETGDDVIAGSFGSAGENDLGYDLLVAGDHVCEVGAASDVATCEAGADVAPLVHYVAGENERMFKLLGDDCVDVRCVRVSEQGGLLSVRRPAKQALTLHLRCIPWLTRMI